MTNVVATPVSFTAFKDVQNYLESVSRCLHGLQQIPHHPCHTHNHGMCLCSSSGSSSTPWDPQEHL